MNPRLASSVGIVALLGLALRLAPIGGERAHAPTPEAREEKSEKKPEAEPHQGPWIALCRHAGKDPVPPAVGAAPDFCLSALAGYQFRLVLATIPDPSRTRLGLSTDRAIETIQMAAREAGWNFASQWLPWKFAASESGAKRWLPRDRDRGEPGLLIFRKAAAANAPDFPRELLLVFVVGDTPTAGIDRIAFSKFLDYAPAFDKNFRFDIAGPTFSGSLPSLAFALAGRYDKVRRAYSGTVTYARYADTFRQQTHIDFRSAAMDSATVEAHLQEVGRRLGIDDDQIAILSEDETAFGVSFEKTRFVNIPFPREIASLRNAVEGVDSEPQDKNQTSAGQVPFSLRDNDGGADSVPLFGKDPTALSKYSAITAIVTRIRGRYRLVEIAATNVLDSLFLASVLHDGAPDTRILTPTADLLFVRAAREQSLGGILSLTPYPLFLPSQSWTNARRETIVFPDGNSEGGFNAMYLLLMGTSSGPYSSAAADYDMPMAPGRRHPVEWLVESSVAGYWPIDTYDHADNAAFPPLGSGTLESGQGEIPPLRRPCWILTGLVLIATLVFSWALTGATRSVTTRSELFRPPSRHRIAHAAFALMALMSLLGMICALILPAVQENTTARGLARGAAVIVLGAAFGAAGRIAYRAGWAGICLAATLFGIPILVSLPFMLHQGWEGRLLALRYLEVASGCSPAVPLVLLLAGLGLGAVLHMNRMAMVSNRNPGWPDAGLDRSVETNVKFFARRIETILNSPGLRQPGDGMNWFGAFVIALLIILATRAWERLYTVDGRLISFLIFGFACALLFGILWSLCGLVAVWTNFRGFLSELNRLPLDGAFRRLPRQFSGSAIWTGMPMSRTFVTFFGSAESLSEFVLGYGRLTQHDARVLADAKAHLTTIEARVSELRTWERTAVLSKHDDLVRDYRNCADFLQRDFLVPRWNGGKTDPDRGDEPADKEKIAADEKVYRLAARFVALRYAGWMRYLLRQMRSLLLFISAGYAFLSLALMSMNFQSPQTIRWFLTALFGIIGAPILFCMIQMDRNPVLSRMADTKVGELNRDFYIKAASYVALPLVGVLSNQFPGFSRLLFSWLQPTLEVLK